MERAERTLALVTPEQVPVHFSPGEPGRRLGALIYDLVVLNVALLLLAIPFLPFGGRPSTGELLTALLVVGGFLARTFYFPWFELRRQGRTPGKRRFGLRVVARDGGPLTTEMVFARNLTRELEVFLPLSLLLGGRSLDPDLPGWVRLAATAWALVLMLIPLLNRQHLRIGDLVAGTVVVTDPRAELLPDLAAEARRTRADLEYTFRREQLDIYGIDELEVLEEVLRRPPSPHHDELLRRLAATIQGKIGWRAEPGRRVHPERFLRAFYAAQRQRLERGLLLGRRRQSKRG